MITKLLLRDFPTYARNFRSSFTPLFFTPASLKRNKNKTSISRVFTVG